MMISIVWRHVGIIEYILDAPWYEMPIVDEYQFIVLFYENDPAHQPIIGVGDAIVE
jgi:hypothetical protein